MTSCDSSLASHRSQGDLCVSHAKATSVRVELGGVHLVRAADVQGHDEVSPVNASTLRKHATEACVVAEACSAPVLRFVDDRSERAVDRAPEVGEPDIRRLAPWFDIIGVAPGASVMSRAIKHFDVRAGGREH
jgi:hypothetical protein